MRSSQLQSIQFPGRMQSMMLVSRDGNNVRTSRCTCNATVSFRVKKRVSYGDSLYVVGNHKVLGKWKSGRDDGCKLSWNKGDVWSGAAEVPDNVALEFKLVNVKGQGEPQWEQGDNRKIDVGCENIAVDLSWGHTGNSTLTTLTPSAGETESQPDGSDPPNEQEAMAQPESVPDPSSQSIRPDFLPQVQWEGKNIEFMQENKHTKERQGVWNVDGLQGPVLALVQGDQGAGSWLQKLSVVKDVLVESVESMRPDLDTLGPVYVYLQWITTGSIPCVEGGGHYRPNKHAELSRIMFRSLEWVIGDSSKGDIEHWVARQMQTKLPSFSESFTASVPLTRIRDIAHRNDIPSELKREIKHTLQNKLHRNAGPEDLVATEAMLQRITAPGANYSAEFVSEFRVFTEELRDFFNASSLVSLLQSLEHSLDESSLSNIKRFLEMQKQLNMNATGSELVACMHQLTTVRSQLVAGLSSGLRNDAADSALAMRQKWRLAELRCEDYAFILLSRYINDLEENSLSALASGRQDVWAHPLGMLVLALRHLGLSGWQPAECFALDNEISAWQKLGATTTKDATLRLMASLQRVQRLTTSFVDGQLQTFSHLAKQLGGALGQPEQLQNIFSEAEIRASVAFQLSKINTLLLLACQEILGLDSFDSVVLGTAKGKLVEVDSIEPGMDLAGGSPCVLLVQSASGDEEISTAGANIKGVMLCQELPHLSHLGVRARQESVPLATCNAPDTVEKQLKPLVGSNVVLQVDADRVSLEASTEESNSISSDATPDIISDQDVPNYSKSSELVKCKSEILIPVSKAVHDDSGAKAATCGQLRSLVEGKFSSPRGVVIPFGVMELAIRRSGLEEDFKSCLEKLDAAAVGPELDNACQSIQQLVKSCLPKEELLTQLQQELEGSCVVIARSSANVEDLAGLSGAGLYESIPNLSLSSTKSLGCGIAEVWASLYSRRAVMSRRAAGVPENDACMAVLVQEMIAPELSFVLHTKNPFAAVESGQKDDLYAEVAPGLGETLASGSQGSAWRFIVSKSDITVKAFANFSKAYLPHGVGQNGLPLGANIYSSSPAVADEVGTVKKRTISYHSQPLSVSESEREKLCLELYKIGKFLEEELGGPQDIEGAVLNGNVHIVQSRPQP